VTNRFAWDARWNGGIGVDAGIFGRAATVPSGGVKDLTMVRRSVDGPNPTVGVGWSFWKGYTRQLPWTDVRQSVDEVDFEAV
jgi:hypothetical protein